MGDRLLKYNLRLDPDRLLDQMDADLTDGLIPCFIVTTLGKNNKFKSKDKLNVRLFPSDFDAQKI